MANEQKVQAIQYQNELTLRDQVSAQAEFQRYIFAALITLLLCVLFMIYRRRLQTRLNKQLRQLVKDRTRELAAKHIELERAYTVMQTQSLTDQLTKLHNRRFLMQKLPEDLANTPADANEQDFVFLLLDLDNFKQVNDTYGHTAGDLILIQFSNLMKQVFRSSDYTIRWGGEEFLVFLTNTRVHYAKQIAENLRVHLFTHDINKFIRVTVSIGVAGTSPGEEDINVLIKQSDQALYIAKAKGRNKVVVWEEDSE